MLKPSTQAGLAFPRHHPLQHMRHWIQRYDCRVALPLWRHPMEKQWVLVVELAGGFTYYVIYIYFNPTSHIMLYISTLFRDLCYSEYCNVFKRMGWNQHLGWRRGWGAELTKLLLMEIRRGKEENLWVQGYKMLTPCLGSYNFTEILVACCRLVNDHDYAAEYGWLRFRSMI